MSSRSSTDDDDSQLPPTVEVARIRSPHGVRGELTVDVLTDVDGRLAVGSELLLVSDGRSRRQVTIAASRPFKTGRIIRLQGCGSREDAARLRGSMLEVERSSVPPAPDGAYYQFELVGCRCRDAEAGELGTVISVVEDGGGLLLEVAEGESAVMVPFVAAFIERIDIGERRIELKLPEGLIEQCTYRP